MRRATVLFGLPTLMRRALRFALLDAAVPPRSVADDIRLQIHEDSEPNSP